MSLIKSNSALVAFDETIFSKNETFSFLNFVQSISFDVESNRIRSKHIGSSSSIVNQFTDPEVNLNITYLQRKDFLNDNLFGFIFSSSLQDSEYYFNNIIDNFSNANSFILFNDIFGSDLIYSTINSSTYSVSIGNLFLNSYSISYRINEIPVVSVDFLSGNLKIEKIQNTLLLKSWSGSNIQLNTSYIDDLKLNTVNAKPLIYVMSGFSLTSNFNEKTFTPGITLNSLLNGVIQSLDVSFNLNRSKLYFFEKTNSVSSRQIILPILGNLKITGTSYNLNIGSIEDFFKNNTLFNLTLDLLDDLKQISATVIYENLVVEKFSYSLNINGMLEYSLECSFEITKDSGYKIIRNIDYISMTNFDQILSSEQDAIVTSDNYLVFARR